MHDLVDLRRDEETRAIECECYWGATRCDGDHSGRNHRGCKNRAYKISIAHPVRQIGNSNRAQLGKFKKVRSLVPDRNAGDLMNGYVFDRTVLPIQNHLIGLKAKPCTRVPHPVSREHRGAPAVGDNATRDLLILNLLRRLRCPSLTFAVQRSFTRFSETFWG
jgi:hypothetical protein